MHGKKKKNELLKMFLFSLRGIYTHRGGNPVKLFASPLKRGLILNERIFPFKRRPFFSKGTCSENKQS